MLYCGLKRKKPELFIRLGYTPVSMERVTDGYVRSVFGRTTGRIFRIT